MYDLLNAKANTKEIFEIIEVFWWLSPSQDLYPFDYAIWVVLENKANATEYPDIGSLYTGIEREWNKLSEKFILKAYKPFWSIFVQ